MALRQSAPCDVRQSPRQRALNRARQWNAQLRCAAIQAFRSSALRSVAKPRHRRQRSARNRKSQPVPLANRQNLEQDAACGSTRKLEIRQLDNVKTEASANWLTDFSDAHLDNHGKKIRRHSRFREKPKVATVALCCFIFRYRRGKFTKLFAVANSISQGFDYFFLRL